MAKKKKEKGSQEKSGDSQDSALVNILHADAKKSLLLVFLVTFGILAILGYFEAAGMLGHWLDKGLGLTFGYGKWLLPIFLFTLSGFMLMRRTTTAKDTVKYLGLFIIFFALLALLHLFLGESAKDYLKVAKRGEGGGYVGYALASGFFLLAGKVAASILLMALFLAGVIAAFNVSLIRWIESLWKPLPELLKKKEKEPVSETQAPESDLSLNIDESLLSVPVVTAKSLVAATAESLEANNIRNVEFRDDDEAALPDEIVEEGETVLLSKPRRRKKSRYLWELPPTDLLESTSDQAVGGDTEHNKNIIQKTLKYFGIEVEPGEVKEGPTVTQYTFTPAMGVKLSRITTLSNDLALALAKHPIRIEAPIPGQSLIGIEVPNKQAAKVRLRSITESREFKDRKSNLMLVLGQDVAGKNVMADLRKMPHLMIAGRTGSGKSVCINTLLLSLLYQNSPEDLKLILVDPKRVELSTYKGIPHLKTDVIVENKKVVNVLKWAVGEMERRYKVLEEAHCRDLMTYREKCARGETKTVINHETNQAKQEDLEGLPYIVIVIDEMADLMVAHGKEVESLVIRLAQMSRAVGIHLILATQRPSVEVLTGLIKANVPTRIAFQVTTQIDSRTILDAGGAEKLLGSGDMLYAPSEGTEMKRIQGVFVSDDEVKRVTNFLRKQKDDLGEEEEEDVTGGGAEKPDDIMNALNAVDEGSKEDDLYEQAKEIVIGTGRASTTYLQTALGVGYPRGARLMHLLEKNGIVSMVGGKKKVMVGKAAGETPAEEGEEEKYQDDHLKEQAERDKWQM